MSMKRRIQPACVAWGFLVTALVLGCGNELVTPPPISVSVVPANATLLAGGSQDFTATVADDPGTQGVTWTITGCAGGAAACGSLTTVTNTRARYTAPAPIPADAHLSITATSVTDNTKSSTGTAALTAIRVSVSPDVGGIVVNGTRLFTATVDNDPTNSGVTWSITGCTAGPAVCGSLANVTNSTATYTAPATVPPGPLGIAATSVTDNTKSFTATVAITVISAGGQIAFESPQGIEVIGADGSGRTVVIGGTVADPAWSPDGARLAFSRTSDGGQTSGIYTARADGSDERRATDGTQRDVTPAWSPDGTKIAFARNGRLGRLEVVNADGSGLIELPWSATDPTWSPDGTKLAFSLFVGTRCGPFGQPCRLPYLAVGSADGTGSASVVGGRFSEEPAWSPDGSELAFHQYGDIWLMNPDGSGARNLTLTAYAPDDRSPAWSPDGAQIVFASAPQNSVPDLYVINRDGTGLRQLTSTAESESNPAWRPGR